MNPFGQAGSVGPRVKAGLIPDDHVLGRRITGGDLLEKIPAEVQTHRGHEAKLGVTLQHFQSSINIFPFVALRLRDHHALAAQCPATPTLGMQIKAAFIRHPDLHGFSFGQGQLCEPLFQFGAEGGAGRRVLQNVRRTRNPQRAVGFSQPPINRLGRPLNPVGFLEPGRYLSRGPPPPGLFKPATSSCCTLAAPIGLVEPGGVSRRNSSVMPPSRNLFNQSPKVLGEQPTICARSR